MLTLKHSSDYSYWVWYDEEKERVSQPFETQKCAEQAKREKTIEWMK